jgi:endonuclease/exonuclease/phosphatase (EEP) superfamily protein YafD
LLLILAQALLYAFKVVSIAASLLTIPFPTPRSHQRSAAIHYDNIHTNNKSYSLVNHII